MSSNSGTLWIVATPLGNPGDLSPRARQILASVDGILAEDTRRSGLLLARSGIEGRSFTSLHDHNEEQRCAQLVARLRAGENLALVSDAGTPLLSDPGYTLVRACRAAGLRVSPLPGPCAAVAALCASGLPPQPFVFLGFAPRKTGEREAFFKAYRELELTLVFFERKDRLRDTLRSAHSVLGRREVCIARELTKTHEEFLFFSLDAWDAVPEDLLGEVTVLVGPPLEAPLADAARVDAVLDEELGMGGRARDVARRASERLPGWRVKELYQRILEKKDPDGRLCDGPAPGASDRNSGTAGGQGGVETVARARRNKGRA
ncbi:16S rRNA (cytidine(1402)-2'-O)-methyltransferase [Desulfovibrio sp. OttesenSCG-928-A18]|nr:16S rRNA (cytidine(1402)-2'-O)-methyltransferase [Desulfovibrio sp. OttesenSCG-928-A18]